MSGAEKYRALKGMRDVLPPEIDLWHRVEQTAAAVFETYGFREIRTPIAESTALFTRGIGEGTDIVEKEMYTFEDKGGRSISLRPEGTASAVRCYIENQLHTLPSPQKYYYSGPMFRYERPQSGRFRQFYQIGVEAFGSASPVLDAELLSMLRQLLVRLGLPELNVQINSIGCEACRPTYKKVLLEFLEGSRDGFCPDCQRRYMSNPLRILDCKVERCVGLRQGAPRITDHLCEDCRTHFTTLQTLLSKLEIPFVVNHEMVRGLDYYTRTAFEVTSGNLGAQNAVAAGGRYDRLVKECGGPDVPAVGFALGMERIAGLLKQLSSAETGGPMVFIAAMGEYALYEGLRIAEKLRSEGIWVETGDSAASLKSQMRKADRLASEYVVILGEDELTAGEFTWKRLKDGSDGRAPLAGIGPFFAERMVSSRKRVNVVE
ncbi:MAG: histidine--tRNA ligase [Nitrospiraceae bacterium]|nr:histidine--tRNA ligase [Nitrospiraceae bacterium]